jgi:hypothetical protein
MPGTVRIGFVKRWTLCGLGAVTLLVPRVALASHIVGLKATVVSVAGATVNINVTGYTDTDGNISGMSARVYWGDGASDGFSGLTFVSQVGSLVTYRRAFSHTYPNFSPRTVTVLSSTAIQNGLTNPITGNIVGLALTNTLALTLSFPLATPAASTPTLVILALALIGVGGVSVLRSRPRSRAPRFAA